MTVRSHARHPGARYNIRMSYPAAVARLYRLAGELHVKPGQPRRKFELEQMRTLMAALGNPQQIYPSVLIAGTNGKGSTAATLAAILAASGYRVGLYTSPHLIRANERIQLLTLADHATRTINQDEIPDHAFADAFDQVEAAAASLVNSGALPDDPSFFEAITAMAFVYFASANLDIAILEVGMGGRLDATNIVDPRLSIITDISLDHTEWLGPTIAAIAREKAGILRPGGTMVTLPQHPEANQSLGEIAVPLNVNGVSATEYIPSRHSLEEGDSFPAERIRNRYSIEWKSKALLIDSPLVGQHQQRNIALALAAAASISNSNDYIIEHGAVEAGIRQTRWPGRFENYPAIPERSRILLDVGHNPAGAWALRAALGTLLDRASMRTLIFSSLNDKPIGEMAQILFPLFDRIILTEVQSPRSATLAQLCEAAEPTGTTMEEAASPYDALDFAVKVTPRDGLIVVTGSVLLVGAVRSSLEEAETSEPARESGTGTYRSSASEHMAPLP